MLLWPRPYLMNPFLVSFEISYFKRERTIWHVRKTKAIVTIIWRRCFWDNREVVTKFTLPFIYMEVKSIIFVTLTENVRTANTLKSISYRRLLIVNILVLLLWISAFMTIILMYPVGNIYNRCAMSNIFVLLALAGLWKLYHSIYIWSVATHYLTSVSYASSVQESKAPSRSTCHHLNIEPSLYIPYSICTPRVLELF